MCPQNEGFETPLSASACWRGLGVAHCMFWFPSAQERQHKMGVWSSSVTRLCESEALFPVWKNNIVFLSFCSHPLKEKLCTLRLLQHRLVTDSLFFGDRCREGYQGIRCDQFLPKTDSILSDPSKFSISRHKSSLTYLIQKQTEGKWRGIAIERNFWSRTTFGSFTLSSANLQ